MHGGAYCEIKFTKKFTIKNPKFTNMKKQYLNCTIKKTDNGDLTIVASDETLDRYGEVVPLDAWDLRNYKKNPILLVDHDYKVSNIVGRAKNLKVTDKALTFTPEFHGLTQLAVEVQKMVESDFAPAVSVGFLPHGPKKDGDKGSNELLEISFVAVGANPNALTMALKSIKPEEEEKVKEWIGEEIKAPSGMQKMRDMVDEMGDLHGRMDDTMGGMMDDEGKGAGNADLMEKVASMAEELADLKEGRVLSGKNRTLIEDCSSALKQATALLDELLTATEPNKGKDGGEQKGRDTKVEHGASAPKKAPSHVVRALQDINSTSNALLRELKGDAQS